MGPDDFFGQYRADVAHYLPPFWPTMGGNEPAPSVQDHALCQLKRKQRSAIGSDDDLFTRRGRCRILRRSNCSA